MSPDNSNCNIVELEVQCTQKNGFDCGIFVILFAKIISEAYSTQPSLESIINRLDSIPLNI